MASVAHRRALPRLPGFRRPRRRFQLSLPRVLLPPLRRGQRHSYWRQLHFPLALHPLLQRAPAREPPQTAWPGPAQPLVMPLRRGHPAGRPEPLCLESP